MRKNLSTSIALLLVGCTSPAAGQVFQELYSFQPFGTNGDGPYGGLVQVSDGSFYGTTFYGGNINSNFTAGAGTVFKITADGVLTTLAAFDGFTTGQHPCTTLVQANDGTFYGSTWESSLFTVTPAGQITPLGWAADGDLYPASDGCLYSSIPAYNDYGYGGAVVRLCPVTGQEETIHTFSPYNDPQSTNGYSPSGAPVEASDGNFYGVTSEGGAYDYGVAYCLTTSGNYTVLCSFSRGPATNDAVFPFGRLLLASDGNFYGVAGAYYEDGYIFRLTTNGVLTTLVRFGTRDAQGQLVWGQTPNGGLIEANDGNFYGTTMYGGDPRFWPTDLGTVFRVTPAGLITTIVSFTETGGPYPGATPHAGLLQGSDGNLYGTTANAGSRGAGNIFRLIMPGPLLSTAPSGAGQLVLSWRTNYQGYNLRSSPRLQPPNWSPCTNAPIVVGHQYYVTNSLTGPAQFFRLQK